MNDDHFGKRGVSEISQDVALSTVCLSRHVQNVLSLKLGDRAVAHHYARGTELNAT